MTSENELSRVDLFEVLSSDRRRALLCFLRLRGGEADLRELATQIAAWEQDTDPEAVSEDDTKRVYISLYQSHLPKLEEYELVSYDSDTKQVSATARTKQVLALFTQPTTQWEVYYLIVSAVGFGVFGLHAAGVITVPIVAFTLVVLGALIGLSIAHYYRHRLVIRNALSEFSCTSGR